MKSTEELEKWRSQIINLNQALLGAVSPNFRRVILDRDEGMDLWFITFILEAESKEDRDEIYDVISELDALQETNIDWHVKVIIDPGEIRPSGRRAALIYWRRE